MNHQKTVRVATCLGLGLVIACGADAMTSRVLVDAGELARDASRLLDAAAESLRDGGAQLGTAQAQDTHDVPCDAEYHQTQSATGTVVDYWQYFAELKVDTDDVIGVDVRTCGRESLGLADSQAQTCLTPPYTCTGKGRPDPAPCAVGATAELEPQLVRVLCGYRQRISGGGTVSSDTGYRYTSVRMVVRR